EAPVLDRGWQAWRDRSVVVLGVDIQDTDDKALKFVRDFQLSFPNAPDPSGKVSIDYGIYGVPETFFIDKQGRIRAKHVGSLSEQVFKQHVERLVSESAAAASESSPTSRESAGPAQGTSVPGLHACERGRQPRSAVTLDPRRRGRRR